MADKWMDGLGRDRSARAYDSIDYIFWLLGSDAAWLPEPVRAVLIEGLKQAALWPNELLSRRNASKALVDEIFRHGERPTRWTKTLRNGLRDQVELTASNLAIQSAANDIVEAFIERDFTGANREVRSEMRRLQQGATSRSR